jgi:hypothetical protein
MKAVKSRMNGSPICRRRGCGIRKEERLDNIGRLSFVCPRCERSKKGLCVDCPAELEKPRAMRCAQCARKRKRKLDLEMKKRIYATPEGRARMLAKKRRQYRRHRDQRRAYEREYRKTHPRARDDFDRLYHREWHRRNRQNPEFRARQNARRRELRQLRQLRHQEAA